MKTIKQTFKFHGGVHPDYNKELARDQPIEQLPTPKLLAVSMSQHLGAPAKCVVKTGDHVAKGEVIGERNGFISVAVHAPVSGTIRSIELRQGASGSWTDSVIIEPDANQDANVSLFMMKLDWKTASREELLARIADAGICGMGGAGFPTVVKLSPPPDKHCEYLILNGAECEPYLTADYRVTLEQAQKIRTGVEIMRKILNGPAVRIAVEANKPEAIAALEKAFADIDGNVEIVVLPVLYPQGSEKHQIYATVGRLVPPGALPISVGCVVDNVGTVAAIADAVCEGKPLIERVTTVSGDGIVQPKNILAPIGTPYSDLVAFCGGEKDGVRKVISGGTMMGFTVSKLDIATTKTASGLLFLTEKRVFQYEAMPCINCGRCLRACPMQLNAASISRAVEADDIKQAEDLGVMNCIECGACSFGCPAYRSITHLCRRAKNSIRARQAAEKAKAAAAAKKA